MSDPCKIEKKGHIAWLTMDKPETLNSMTADYFHWLLDNVPALDRDPEVRVIILKAEGRAFCAGLDLTSLGSMLGGQGVDMRETLRRSILDAQEAMSVLEKCSKPVIAAVHGPCIGGGIDLITCCDIRLCSADAKYSVRETRMAMVADLGTLQRLHHIVGQSWYRELVLTGRDFLADEALQMRLVSRVLADRDELYAEAEKLAEQIAFHSPLAVQGAKDVMNFSRDHDVYTSLQYVAQKNSAILVSEDLMEAATAFLEKRAPVFKGK